ncbi:SDR family oxidoreductase [Rouxiella badensis]|jgi:nucleoside-diphosphate-sugar epimerase|uniref:SDR family oxidoreductase n=1 Tax=Rouxiella badensis TaxID=1646377 RepID=UPI0013EF1B41|nr:SDR family oxidoreductase [Rouxiella badensis]QII38589.1 SDR family oxidoreductase [Rouxiella badensis]
MRVFVTGATGFIGSAVVQELLNAGHQVLGLARSESAAKALQAAGAEPHFGSLDDLPSLKRGAQAADGVIHTAFIHDFTQFAASCDTDLTAIQALGDALEGTHKPLVVTSGIALLAQGQVGKETDLASPDAAGKLRARSEQAALALAERGVRSSLVRLPPSVHGDGDHAFVPALIGIAKSHGVSGFIGDGNNRWPAVHRFDAARLFRLALEQAPAGAIYHGVGDEGVPTRDIAELIGRALNLPVKSITAADAAEHFGWLGHFFAVDVPASSAITQSALGWSPTHKSLREDLESGSYFG